MEEGANVWYVLEDLRDYSSNLFTWLYDSLTVEELQSMVNLSDVDPLWLTEKTDEDLDVEERLTRAYVDHLTGVTNEFREVWEKEFGVDFANEDIIVK